MRSTASWVDSFSHVSDLVGLADGARVWVPGPLTATMNLFAAVHATWAGGTVLSEPRAVSHAHLTPAALSRVLADPALRTALPGATVVVAGDRLSASLREEAESAGLRVAHYYGAAELSFVAWGADADDLRPFPGVQVRLGDEGEVWVRSPYLADGYLEGDGPLRRDNEGYATVGDRGRWEGGERLVVDGRPGWVTTAGASVDLAAVEAKLRSGGYRGEIVVVGLPHPDLGSVVAAVLTSPHDRAGLQARSREVLDPAARPRLWFHVDPLPLTPAGKTDRAALVARLDGTTVESP